MITERLVWKVKPGKQAQFIEWLRPYLLDESNPIKRAYTPKIGAWGTVVAELEYEDMADWERAWNEWQSPEKAEEVARENELAEIVESRLHI